MQDEHVGWDRLLENQYGLYLMPRESLKTTLFVESYVTKKILDNPEVRIAVITDTYRPHATQRVGVIIKYLKTDAAEMYCPGIRTRVKAGSTKENEIDIPTPSGPRKTKEPNLIATGVESPLTGGHFDLIVLDDVVNEKDKYSQTIRDKKREWFVQLFDLAEPQTQILVIGTRWHPQDLYQHIMDEYGDYFTMHTQSIFNDDGSLWLPEFYESRLGLLQRNPIHFSHQYLNLPIAGQDAPINLEWFRTDTSPVRTDLVKVVLAIDPAYGEKEATTGCYNAGVVIGYDKENRVWLLDGFITRDTLKAVRAKHATAMFNRWQPDFIIVEDNGPQEGARLFFSTSEVYGRCVKGTSAQMSRDKLGRAQGWISYLETTGIWYAPGEWWREASYQLDLFPIGDYVDFPDAISVGWPEFDLLTRRVGGSVPKAGGKRTFKSDGFKA